MPEIFKRTRAAGWSLRAGVRDGLTPATYATIRTMILGHTF